MNISDYCLNFISRQRAILAVAATTLLAIMLSIYSLNSGWFIVYQNLFYFPIIISCVYYLRRGFVFSVLLAFLYFFLVIAFTRDAIILQQASIRVLIFILVAGVITFLSLRRKRAEEGLKTSQQQLRALAARLQEVREEAMKVVAREIHDDLGGGLAGLKMELTSMLHKVNDAEVSKEQTSLMNRIHTSSELIDQMIQVVRRIEAEVRPPVLDDLGLIAALEWQLREVTNRKEIPHEFSKAFDYVTLEQETATAVFRIFQEALTNVVRHSGATKVVVVLREGERSLFGDESLVLEIRDNGRGITEGERLNPESLGLLGMKERVLAFGGELSICGEPGGGTTMVLKIPRTNLD